MTLLPQLGYEELYSAYRQNEPWDSEHNKGILAQMPDVYRSEGDGPDSINSSYFVFTGEETMFPSDKVYWLRDILDGMANTLLVVESRRAVPWTKPEDIPFDSKTSLPKLGGWYPDGFNAVTWEKTVHFFSLDFDETTLKCLIMPKDGRPAEMPHPDVPENDSK